MKRLFGGLKMSWPAVILFAIVVGAYAGTMLLIPATANTSFRDIGILYEWWVVFAVIIVVNCKHSWEAMLKCFVFFLISQPVIYGVEICFGTMTMKSAWLYYQQWWLAMTLLTLPGGFIAYFSKKQNVLGSVILSLGNTLQLLHGCYYTLLAVLSFPHHLLSALFCFASVLVMSFFVQRKKQYQWLTLVLSLLFAVVVLVLMKATNRYIYTDGQGFFFP